MYQASLPMQCALTRPKPTHYNGRKRLPAAVPRCTIMGCTRPASRNFSCCHKHAHELKKTVDPARYLFDKKKARAIERGKDWTITLENWREWCAYYSYVELTGRSRDALSIDRKYNEHGYHIWNIRPLPYGENSRKAASPYQDRLYEMEKHAYAGDECDSNPLHSDAAIFEGYPAAPSETVGDYSFRYCTFEEAPF